MATQKAVEPLFEEEFKIKRTGVRQTHHEAGKSPSSTAGHLTEVSPVDVALLAPKSVEAQKGFASEWAQASNEPSELNEAAGVAALTDHFEDAGGAQARMALERLSNELDVGVGSRGAHTGAQAQAVGLERPLHGITVEAEFVGNGADLPVLGVEQTCDPGDEFSGDHGSTRPRIDFDEPPAPTA
jgi:hypothetical protein